MALDPVPRLDELPTIYINKPKLTRKLGEITINYISSVRS